MSITWHGASVLGSKPYTCGYCGKVVASANGWNGNVENPGVATRQVFVYICPNCKQPTYFDGKKQVPDVAPGVEVANLPTEIDALYREARNAIAASSYTASVLTARKLLMHIGVAQGAPEGQNFFQYVEHLADKGYVPPNGRGWVDHVRKKGNEANHEIKVMAKADAEELITFLEMLLKFIYEFPSRVPPS